MYLRISPFSLSGSRCDNDQFTSPAGMSIVPEPVSALGALCCLSLKRGLWKSNLRASIFHNDFNMLWRAPRDNLNL